MNSATVSKQGAFTRLILAVARRREDIVWAGFFLAVLGGCLWVLVQAATVAVQIGAAVIAIVGGIIAAMVKYGLDLDAQRRHAIFLEKQKNYTDLLATIAEFARQNTGPAADKLCSAHLGSWAFGDLPVLAATNAFQSKPTQESLMALLRAIRLALQQDTLPETFLATYKTEVLFPPSFIQVPLAGLKPGAQVPDNSGVDHSH